MTRMTKLLTVLLLARVALSTPFGYSCYNYLSGSDKFYNTNTMSTNDMYTPLRQQSVLPQRSTHYQLGPDSWHTRVQHLRHQAASCGLPNQH